MIKSENSFDFEEILIILDLLDRCQLFIEQIKTDIENLNRIILSKKLKSMK